MTIDNSKVTVFDITETVTRKNNFADNSIKAYEVMNNDWYNYEITDLFWNIIDNCLRENKLDYELWFFCSSDEIDATKYNRLKYKEYIKQDIENNNTRIELIKENKKDLTFSFICAINLTHNNQFFNRTEIDLNMESKNYYILLPKNIQISNIEKFIEIQMYYNFNKNDLLEIDKNIYDFLIKERGIFIEEYNDSKYYEYKGENEGYIVIDPNMLCGETRSRVGDI